LEFFLLTTDPGMVILSSFTYTLKVMV